MKRIVIDPGHGGTDPGAISPTGTKEKDIIAGIISHLRKLNHRADLSLIYTRNTDSNLSLNSRGQLGAAADAFISLHINSASSRDARGMEIFLNYNSPLAVMLANKLESRILPIMGKSRGLKTKVNSAGQDDYYGVLRPIPPSVPAVILEVGFLSNIYDEVIMLSRTNQKLIAIAIMGAIEEFFPAEKPEPVPVETIATYQQEINRLLAVLDEKRSIILAQARMIKDLRAALSGGMEK